MGSRRVGLWPRLLQLVAVTALASCHAGPVGFEVQGAATHLRVVAGKAAEVALQITPDADAMGSVAVSIAGVGGVPLPGVTVLPDTVGIKGAAPRLVTETVSTDTGLAPGVYEAVVSVRAGGVTRGVPVSLTVDPAPAAAGEPTPGGPDFQVTVADGPLSAARGAEVTSHLVLVSRNGFRGAVSVAPSQAGTGVVVGPATASLAGDDTMVLPLDLTVAGDAAPGAHVLPLVAEGGGVRHEVEVLVSVPAGGAPDFSMEVTEETTRPRLGDEYVGELVVVSHGGLSGEVDFSVLTDPTAYCGMIPPQRTWLAANGVASESIFFFTHGCRWPLGSAFPVTVTATSGDVHHTLSLVLRRTLPFATVRQTVPSRLASLATADFNGDGRADIAGIDTDGTGPFFFEAKSDGSLRSTGSYRYIGLKGLAAGDFNGDGAADVAVGGSPSGDVAIFPGSGTGGLGTAEVLVATPFQATRLLTGDLNRDGRLDLVAFGDGQAVGLLANGDGTFSVGSPVWVEDPDAAALGDVTGDGYPDLVVGGNGVRVRPGLGDGSFGAGVGYDSFEKVVAVGVGYLDADGYADVVTLDDTGTRLEVRRGRAFGLLSLPVTEPATPGSSRLVVADLNADGVDDVVTAGGGTTPELYVGEGNGRLQPGTALGYGDPQAATVTTADVDGNGLTDVIFVGPAQGITVSEAQP